MPVGTCKVEFGAENLLYSSYLNYVSNVKEGTYLYPIPDTQMKAKEGLYTQNEAYR